MTANSVFLIFEQLKYSILILIFLLLCFIFSMYTYPATVTPAHI
jgi:hypothetical protein